MTDQLLSSSWAMRRNISIGAGQDTSMDPDMSRFPKPLRNVAATVSIVIMIVGVIGNLLTIVALLKYPKVRNVAAAFIVSLCVADFVFCSLVLPFDSMRFIDVSWAHVSFLCSLVPFLRYGNTGVSLLFVGAITINRYIMIAHHSIYAKVYKKHWIALMLLFCVVFSYGMQIPTLLGSWGQFDYDPNLETCSIVPDANGRSPKTFLFVTGFFIPCIVIVACYAKIFWVVHKSEKRMRQHTQPQQTQHQPAMQQIKSPYSPARPESTQREIKKGRSEWRITKMVLAIFLGFLACYLPITIVKIADPEVRNPAFHVIGYLLLYVASCVNPIIYVIMNKQYRQAYAGVISCSRLRASLTPHGSSAPGHNNNYPHQDNSKDLNKTMVSTVSIGMNSIKDDFI
uniref:G-protein coupled receptors family 1 profile domain-containing protein n=1 Tax=Trichogramma kaykai TaxID=54128 RepID=A0ABD2XJ65_9HYME